MKNYEYLVAYNFNKEGYLTQCGGICQILRKTKIKTYEDVMSVSKYLTDKIPGASNLAVYNFILLGKRRV